MQENMKHAKSIKLEFRGFEPAITENLIKNFISVPLKWDELNN